jgi:hypothetical protein
VGPYVSGRAQSGDFVARLRNGLAEAMLDPHLAAAREDLLLRGMEVLPIERYAEIGRLESEALELGYRDSVSSDHSRYRS